MPPPPSPTTGTSTCSLDWQTPVYQSDFLGAFGCTPTGVPGSDAPGRPAPPLPDGLDPIRDDGCISRARNGAGAASVAPCADAFLSSPAAGDPPDPPPVGVGGREPDPSPGIDARFLASWSSCPPPATATATAVPGLADLPASSVPPGAADAELAAPTPAGPALCLLATAPRPGAGAFVGSFENGPIALPGALSGLAAVGEAVGLLAGTGAAAGVLADSGCVVEVWAAEVLAWVASGRGAAGAAGVAV